MCFVYCILLHFIVLGWAKVSFLHGLCKNSLSTACPACILLLADICHFLSSLLAVPGLHDCSSTDALCSLCRGSDNVFFVDFAAKLLECLRCKHPCYFQFFFPLLLLKHSSAKITFQSLLFHLIGRNCLFLLLLWRLHSNSCTLSAAPSAPLFLENHFCFWLPVRC